MISSHLSPSQKRSWASSGVEVGEVEGLQAGDGEFVGFFGGLLVGGLDVGVVFEGEEADGCCDLGWSGDHGAEVRFLFVVSAGDVAFESRLRGGGDAWACTEFDFSCSYRASAQKSTLLGHSR